MTGVGGGNFFSESNHRNFDRLWIMRRKSYVIEVTSETLFAGNLFYQSLYNRACHPSGHYWTYYPGGLS